MSHNHNILKLHSSLPSMKKKVLGTILIVSLVGCQLCEYSIKMSTKYVCADFYKMSTETKSLYRNYVDVRISFSSFRNP